MATETRSSATQTDDASTGTVTWGTPSNAAASDNSYATLSGGAGATSHYHMSLDFGFTTIQVGDNLTALTFRFERKKTGGTVNDNHVYLVIGGVIQTGTDYKSASTYAAADQYDSYVITGLPTISQLKASNFGIVLSSKDASGFPWTVDLDHVDATATFTPAAAFIAPRSIIVPPQSVKHASVY